MRKALTLSTFVLIIHYCLRISAIITGLGLCVKANAQQKLMHYWHFNHFSGVGAAVDPSTLIPYRADYSLMDTSLVKVAYVTFPGTSTNYKTYWDATSGDTVNLRNGAVAGNCMRLRNPSDSMQLQFYIPSTLFRNIRIKYEVQKSSASNGAANNHFAYSIDSGATWLTSGLSMTTYSVTNYSGGSPAWPLSAVSINITDSLAFNNPRLVFRISFDGSGSTGTSGNNRIDNVSVEGDSIVYPAVYTSGNLSTFIASKNESSAAQMVQVSGVNLEDTLWVTAPAYFGISLTENGIYSDRISVIPSAGNVTSTTVYVKFIPQDTGTFSGELITTSTGASAATILLNATTLQIPVITVNGAAWVSFPNTPRNSIASAVMFRVSAVNLTDLLWIKTRLPFGISPDNDHTHIAQTITMEGGSVTNIPIYVFFNPSAFGTFNDSIVLSSDGANEIRIILSGSTFPPPVFNLSKHTLDTFKNAKVGGSGLLQDIDVTGAYLNGPVTITITDPFKVSADKVTYTAQLTLYPDSGDLDQKVTVLFSPSFSGDFANTLSVSSPDTGVISIPVYGTTFNPFEGLSELYYQNFTSFSNANPPAGWDITDTALWSIVNSNASSNYAFASGGNCLRFDNEGSELPKAAYVTLSDHLNTLDYKDIRITWAARRTNNFLNGVVNGKSFLMYSINGTDWDSVYYTTEPNNSNLWAYVNNDVLISLPEACNHKNDVKLRWMFTSEGLGSSGTYRMDDLRVFGTIDTNETGISSVGDQLERLKIYPNPFSDEIRFDFEGKHPGPVLITLSDLTGKSVMGRTFTPVSGETSFIVATSMLNPGIYIIRTEAADGSVKIQKLVK